MQVQSLGWEDLEKGMVTHSGILASPGLRTLVVYSSWGHKESDTARVT